MTEAVDTHFEGEPAAMRAWLATLGWDEAQGIHSTPTAPEVAAFGPFAVRPVFGQDIAFVLLVLAGAVTPPAGVMASDAGSVAVGVTMQGPRKPTPRQWLDRAMTLERQAEVYAAAQGGPLAFVLFRLAMAAEVDVTLPETIAGVSALAGAGLITAEEQAALLAA